MKLLSIDDGSSHIKVCSREEGCLTIPSYVKAGNHSHIGIGGVSSQSTTSVYSTEEGDYTVGNNLTSISPTGSRDYQTSPENRVLVNHAIHTILDEQSLSDEQIALVTSLPFSAYYLPNSDTNRKLIEKKAQNITSHNVLNRNKAQAKIARCFVLAEGLGAWVDMAFHWQGDSVVPDKDFCKESVAIVDIGGHTTDIVVVKNAQIDPEKSTTIANSGMLSVYNAVAGSILSANPEIEDSTLDTGKLREAVDNATPYKIWGEEISIQKFVENAKQNLKNNIVSNLREKLAQGAQFERIIFVGGGSEALSSQLKGSFKNMHIHKAPQHANAQGMLKYLTAKFQRT